ncbi:HNH endonuclease [Arthrobacter sp. I2-34]|uniref:HNH endonuclease n=1 Tax=Arthrobacter hankyongi TaxID=2904801 RepID=A0ABS9LCJ6_9MICC|nr:HNH endonuclease signature motif containing protein [Arthrobacter hankyongi]MCG2624406.1 HNH endonuclease [Arthrobacter hankyongi]
MTISALDPDAALASLNRICAEITAVSESFVTEMGHLPPGRIAAVVASVEQISRVVGYFQVAGAWAVEHADVARVGERDDLFGAESVAAADAAPSDATVTVGAVTGEAKWADPADTFARPATTARNGKAKRGTSFRTNAEYLASRLRITVGEAKCRIRTGQAVLARRLPTGEQGTVALPVLGEALAEGKVSARAAALIVGSVARVRPAAGLEAVAPMEQALVAQAMEDSQDVLAQVAAMWEAAADQDGTAPSEAALQAKQGVFYRGRRGGLHYLTLAADDAQFQTLQTVMNSATNPRLLPGNPTDGNGTASSAGPGIPLTIADGQSAGPDSLAVSPDGCLDEPEPDPRSFAQKRLAGLVAGCRIALAADKLPATGGHKAQVMVTIGYRELAGEVAGAAYPVFGAPVNPRTVRKLACDADIIPVVLGSSGEVLDVGRANRFFPPAIRRALVARDRGCAFPGCTMPAVWTEAHHIVPWWRGGKTKASNGCLLCIFHHDLIDEGDWDIVVEDGVPWFIPPACVDPRRRRRRNRYWHTAASAAAIGADRPEARGSGTRTLEESEAVSTPKALWS